MLQSFSALLSSIGGQPQAQQSSSNVQKQPQTSQQSKNPNGLANGTRLVANNTAAGVKRRSEEPESISGPKTIKVEQNGVSDRPAGAAPSKRFQLSARGESQQKLPSAPQGPSTKQMERLNIQKPATKPVAKAATPNTPKSAPAVSSSVPAKRGFAAAMERGKNALEAAKATAPTGITHKPAEKMSKKERLRAMEEAKAQRKSSKSGKEGLASRSHSSSPVPAKASTQKKGQELSYKGTMKKAAQPLSYKGTMRAASAGGPAREKEKKKGLAQDKYGGYASWSDLDDAEDEEEDYDSEGSSDMEGGFDDVEREETTALKAARKEDMEALEEEEAHRREKLARKRRLEELSNSAAARKKKF